MTARGWIEIDRSTRAKGRKRRCLFRAVFMVTPLRFRRRFRTRDAAESFLADDGAKAAWAAGHKPRKSAEARQECLAAKWQRKRARERARCAISADCYARRRARLRVNKLKFSIRHGRRSTYIPQFARRIPDWCFMGDVLDARSQWLITNLTPSQRAYARDLAIERNIQKGEL